jgi:hypothetical protein
MFGRSDRRQAISLLGGSLVASILKSTRAFASSDEKRVFMQAALADMAREHDRARDDHERLRRQGIRSALIKVPRIIPFGDWDNYYLDSELVWEPNKGQRHSPVTVPKGFVTDLASIPRALWSLLPKTGRYAYAATVHDYLYWEQNLTRAEADDIFLTALQDSQVAALTSTVMSQAVKLAGAGAWTENKRLKSVGEKRILADFPKDPLISWETWRKRTGSLKH